MHGSRSLGSLGLLEIDNGSLIILDAKKNPWVYHELVMLHPILSTLLSNVLPSFAAARLEASLIAALPNGLANRQVMGRGKPLVGKCFQAFRMF